MEREYVYTIQPHDVGRKSLPLDHDHYTFIGELMGEVKVCDIGKRIYRRNGIYEVESNAQYTARTGGKF